MFKKRLGGKCFGQKWEGNYKMNYFYSQVSYLHNRLIKRPKGHGRRSKVKKNSAIQRSQWDWEILSSVMTTHRTGIYIRGVWAQCCSSPLLCMRITNFLQIYDHPSVVQSGKTFFSPAESIVYYFLLQLLCFLVIMFFSLCLELLLKSQFSHVFVPELGPLQWRSSRKRVSLTVEVY